MAWAMQVGLVSPYPLWNCMPRSQRTGYAPTVDGAYDIETKKADDKYSYEVVPLDRGLKSAELSPECIELRTGYRWREEYRGSIAYCRLDVTDDGYGVTAAFTDAVDPLVIEKMLWRFSFVDNQRVSLSLIMGEFAAEPPRPRRRGPAAAFADLRPGFLLSQ